MLHSHEIDFSVPLLIDVLLFFDQISRRVFEVMRSECSGDAYPQAGINASEMDSSKGDPYDERLDASKGQSEKEGDSCTIGCLDKVEEASDPLYSQKDERSKSIPFELYKRRTTVVVRREIFLNVVCDSLAEYKYVGPNQRADLVLACRYRISLFPY